MRAVVFDHPGDEDVLAVATVADPAISPGKIRIAVTAAGVNRADLLQRRGLYPPPPGASDILGLECAGTVAEVGDNVERFRPGDRVMALLAGGGYAEHAVVDQRCALPVPDHLTDVEAAALPEVFLTAYLNLFLLGGLVSGSTALVHGGSGGVGTAAIRLGRAAGAHILVTAGSPSRCRRCLELGALAAIDYHAQDFVEPCLEATAGSGVDVALDCVGGTYLSRHLQVLAVGGRLVVIGLMGGSRAELDLAVLLRRRLTVMGSNLRSRDPADKGVLIGSFLDRFGTALAQREIHPVVDRALPLGEAVEAHRLLASGAIFGKIVLTTT